MVEIRCYLNKKGQGIVEYALLLAFIVGIAMMGTLILLTMTNFLIAMLFLLVVVTIGYLIIKTKQKQGLHNKKICRDCLIYHNLFMIKR